MTVVEILGIVLGSNVALEVVKSVLARKQTHAGTIKLKNESGQIVLEGELKVTEFYKEQLEAILQKYNNLEQKFDEKVLENQSLEEKISLLETQYADLQRQFTVLKTQLGKI